MDLIDLLTADHQNLKGAVGADGFVAMVEEHLTVERALLYPEVERVLAPGDDQLGRLHQLDHALERAASAHDDHTDELLQAHIAGQDGLFSKIRESVPAETLRTLGEQVPLVVAEAPTHAHPHLPDHGPFREIATEVAATVDQIEDHFRASGSSER